MTSASPLPVPAALRANAAERLRWLDGVRALAATYVVLHHVWLMSYLGFPENSGPWFLGWLIYGHLAVAVFIVVSGISLALVPLRHGWALPGGARQFLLRRAWRILPSYWAALAVSALVVVFLTGRHTGTSLDVTDVLVHFLLLQDVVGVTPPNGVFWSIAVEWHIYFLFPVILLGVRLWRASVVIAVVVTLVLAAHLAGSVWPVVAKTSHLTPQFLVLFVLGVAAAGATASGARLRAVTISGVLVLVSVLCAAAALGPTRIVAEYFWVDLATGVGIALLLAGVARGALPGLGSLLSVRPLAHVGTFSYSLYLLHAPALDLVRLYMVEPMDLSPSGTFLVMLVIGVPAAFAASYAFFLLFERPFIRHRSPRALVLATSRPRWSGWADGRKPIPAPRKPVGPAPDHATLQDRQSGSS